MNMPGECVVVHEDCAKPYYFRCPKCGSSERFIRVDEPRTFMVYLLLLLTGHLIFALLTGGPRPKRTQCGKCLYVFKCPALPSNPSNWKPLVIAVLSLSFGLAMLLPLYGDLRVLIECYPEISGVLRALQRIPSSVYAGLSVAAFGLAAAAAITIHFLNFSYRANVARAHRLTPEPPIT